MPYQTSATGATTTRFLYDGDALIAEYNTGGTVLRRYVHGPAIDEPIVWYEGTGTTDRRWLHADQLGSVVAISDADGEAMAINTYDEYGVPGSSNTGRFQYTGQAWLPELALYHYKARTYAPALGRFLQTDPVLTAGGMNLYAYVGNDPLNLSDPSGLRPNDDIIITGARRQCEGDYCITGSFNIRLVQEMLTPAPPGQGLIAIGELTGRTAADQRTASEINELLRNPTGTVELRMRDGTIIRITRLGGNLVLVEFRKGIAFHRATGTFLSPEGQRLIRLTNLRAVDGNISIGSEPTQIDLLTSRAGNVVFRLDRAFEGSFLGFRLELDPNVNYYVNDPRPGR